MYRNDMENDVINWINLEGSNELKSSVNETPLSWNKSFFFAFFFFLSRHFIDCYSFFVCLRGRSIPALVLIFVIIKIICGLNQGRIDGDSKLSHGSFGCNNSSSNSNSNNSNSNNSNSNSN